MRSAPLVGDELRHATLRLQALLSTAPAPWLRRLADQSARAQLGKGIMIVDRQQSGDPPSAHRHDDLAAVADVLDVAAELVMQFPHADLAFETWPM
jgi:hypothetical protein